MVIELLKISRQVMVVVALVVALVGELAAMK